MGEIATLRKKRSRDFTNLSNELLRDSRLSWKARGLFSYLWSHSDNFKFSVQRLTTKAADGRDSTTSGLGELQKLGYLNIERIRGSGGRFIRAIWTLSEEPIAAAQSATEPQPENPDVAADHERDSRIPVDPSCTTEESSVRRTTTTTAPALVSDKPPSKTESVRGVVVIREEEQNRQLIRPTRLPEGHGAEAIVMVLSRIPDFELAQQLLDELDAKLEAKQVQKPWPCYLDGLIRKALAGEFRFAAGIATKERRKARLADAEREAQRATERANFKKPDPLVVQEKLREIQRSLAGASS